MDWLITWFLMGLIVFAGVIESAMRSGLPNPYATEPLLSQQNIDMGVILMAASGVAFWRSHTWFGGGVLALGVLGVMSGLYGLFKYRRASR